MAAKDTLLMLAARRSVLEAHWGEPIRVRIAICEGDALVGFLGRGTLKSFTAIGETVSLAHRLCSVCEPNGILFHSAYHARALALVDIGMAREMLEVGNLKGFGDLRFQVTQFKSNTETASPDDHGRCPDCATPLIIEELEDSSTRVTCPGCRARGIRAL
jgi:class 3 adenylate cyclase